MDEDDKPLLWLDGEIKTPPFSVEARNEAGRLLRRLQGGESLAMPHSRPMKTIGGNCHELRVRDATKNWRIFYRIDKEVILILGVFNKTTEKTPKTVIEKCQARLAKHDLAAREARERENS